MMQDTRLKKLDFLFNHCTELFTSVMQLKAPAHKVRADYFRKNKYLGSRDKKIITEVVYFLLRNQLKLNCDSKNFIAAAFYILQTTNSIFKAQIRKFNLSDSIPIYLNNVELDFSNINHSFSSSNEIDAFPKKFTSLLSNYNEDDLSELLISLNTEASTDIRIVKNFNNIKEELKSNKYEYNKNILENCLKIEGNINLSNLKTYRNGDFEVQDEGSQLVSIIAHNTSLINSQAQQDTEEINTRITKKLKILDACAGGGGKTIHLAELTNDKADITASDINPNRLKEVRRRADKFGYKSIEIKQLHDRVQDYDGKFDMLLIDAPCTGSGTIRRSPERRYMIDQDMVKKYKELQAQILEQYKNCVKNDGIIIYATCSIIKDENEDVVNEFTCKNKNFTFIDLKESLEKLNLPIDRFKFTGSGMNLLPNITETDGFFISAMQCRR